MSEAHLRMFQPSLLQDHSMLPSVHPNTKLIIIVLGHFGQIHKVLKIMALFTNRIPTLFIISDVLFEYSLQLCTVLSLE